ncbi:hypothetical protein V8E54_007926 [Elaphomyces granulatus]
MLPQLRPKPTQRDQTDSPENEDLGSASGQPEPRSFEFVPLTGTGKPNPDVQTTIRQHVMRDVSRRASVQSSSESNVFDPRAGEAGGGAPEIQRFRLRSEGLRPVHKVIRQKKASLRSDDGSRPGPDPADPQNATRLVPVVLDAQAMDTSQPLQHANPGRVGSEQTDPSDMLLIANTPRAEFLVKHFQEHLVQASPIMMALRKTWFASSLQDPAIFLVKLCLASANLSLLQNDGYPSEALEFKNGAIRIIQKRIEDGDINDATVAAVASIVSCEVSFVMALLLHSVYGPFETVEIHMNGLQQMIQVRGGMMQSISCPHLRRLIAWADIQSANVLSRLPRLAPLDTLLDPASLTNPFTSLIGSQETDFYNQQAEFYAIDIRLTNIFVELQQLMALLGEDPVFDLHLSDVVYTLQRRLMCLVYDVNEQIELIERTYCFAGLIFLECYIRSVRPNSDIAKALNDRLHSSMMELPSGPMRPAGDQSEDGGTPELWFWALFVGALAATEKRECSLAWKM